LDANLSILSINPFSCQRMDQMITPVASSLIVTGASENDVASIDLVGWIPGDGRSSALTIPGWPLIPPSRRSVGFGVAGLKQLCREHSQDALCPAPPPSARMISHPPTLRFVEPVRYQSTCVDLRIFTARKLHLPGDILICLR
jgi:hypothetical protein